MEVNRKLKEEEVDIVVEDGSTSPPVVLQSRSCGSIIGSVIFHVLTFAPTFFAFLLASFFVVYPQEEVLLMYWGKLCKIVKTPGFQSYDWFGRKLIRISTRIRNFDIKKTTVVDQNGNPIIVSAVVTYKIVDTVKAAFSVLNVNDYMERQAVACLKKVCSQYPYESKDGHSLQKESDTVSKQMRAQLQKKALLCGVSVISFELCDLQYAPEIAQGMLVRQQATALLDARKVIVDGAVGIVNNAIYKLAETGIKLSSQEQSRLVSNLLTVICSDARVQPTYSISDNDKSSSNADLQEEILKALQQIRMNTTLPQNRQNVEQQQQ